MRASNTPPPLMQKAPDNILDFPLIIPHTDSEWKEDPIIPFPEKKHAPFPDLSVDLTWTDDGKLKTFITQLQLAIRTRTHLTTEHLLAVHRHVCTAQKRLPEEPIISDFKRSLELQYPKDIFPANVCVLEIIKRTNQPNPLPLSAQEQATNITPFSLTSKTETKPQSCT